jgi:hypothetical protein
MAADPISGTGAAAALAGVTFFGVLSGLDYDVVFGAFAGAVYYVATVADLTASRRVAYFLVSYIAGVLCAGLVGSKLAVWTGYSDKPLDALGAVLISALAIKILTFVSDQDLTGLLSRIKGRTNGNR